MGYKNKEDQLACNRRWYSRNKVLVRSNVKQRRDEIRQWLIKFKSNLKCERCPENHPACLDFHHNDSGKKLTEISTAVKNGWGLETIKAEITKCSVMCSNCHRKLHSDLA